MNRTIASIVIVLMTTVLVGCDGATTRHSPSRADKPKTTHTKKKDGRMKFITDKAQSVHGVEIKLTDFKDVFLRRNGIHVDETQFSIICRKGGEEKRFDAKYGTVVEAFGLCIEVGYCATGTRDWPSFAELTITNVIIEK